MNNIDDLKGDLCLYHFEESDFSCNILIQRICHLVNSFGIFELKMRVTLFTEKVLLG